MIKIKGKNKMENLSSAENHLAQCGPKKESEGLLPQLKTIM